MALSVREPPTPDQVQQCLLISSVDPGTIYTIYSDQTLGPSCPAPRHPESRVPASSGRGCSHVRITEVPNDITAYYNWLYARSGSLSLFSIRQKDSTTVGVEQGTLTLLPLTLVSPGISRPRPHQRGGSLPDYRPISSIIVFASTSGWEKKGEWPDSRVRRSVPGCSSWNRRCSTRGTA